MSAQPFSEQYEGVVTLASSVDVGTVENPE